VASITITGGTLVEEQRKQVVETIAAVNEGNASVKGGTLVMKRIGEAVDVIQGGIQAMEQPQPSSPNPERQFYQSFRQGITPPTEVQSTQVSDMVSPQTEQSPIIPQPISSPEFKTTEPPSMTQPEVEERPTVDGVSEGQPQSIQEEEPPAVVDEEVVSEPEITYVNNMFDSLKDVEGETSHVDGRGYFTMAYGVVPDADSVTKSDGTKFDPRGTHGFTTDTAGTVDVSKATHTLNVDETTSYTLKREDYDSDKTFAKAVVDLYDTEAAKKYGEGWDDLPDSSKRMALDLAWNGGVGAIGWDSVQTAMKEADKESPSTDNLFGFTVNFRSGTEYPRGLFKRRLIQYNIIANEADKAATYSTEVINDAQGKRIGTKYIANRSDGTEIGSYSRTDKPEDPDTKEIELRTPSTEKIEANVAVQ